MEMRKYDRWAIWILSMVGVFFLLKPFTPVATHAGGPWYVAPGGNDSNSCLDPASACATINAAIGKASPGDTIYVASGTYKKVGSIGTEVVQIDRDVTLSGGWDGGFSMQSGRSRINGEGLWLPVLIPWQFPEYIVTIERFVIENGGGGGISSAGDLTLDNSEVQQNIGRGIRNGHGELILNQSSVSNNLIDACEAGAGIGNSGTLVLNNSTVSGNRTTCGYGGGIHNRGKVWLNNSTVTGNWAYAGGGGIVIEVDDPAAFSVNLRNSILAGNLSTKNDPDCIGTFKSSGHNILGKGCNLSPGPGDLIGQDPRLLPLEGSPGYHPLQPTSPAIDGGNPDGCKDHLGGTLVTDQRGFPRVGRCDIGAVEMQPLEASQLSVNVVSAAPNEKIHYLVSLKTAGDTPIAGVVVTDTLPAGLSYVPNSLQATGGTANFASGTVHWNGTIQPGNEVHIAFAARVNASTPLGTTITNRATIGAGGQVFSSSAPISVYGVACNLSVHPGNPVLGVGAPGAWDSAGVWDPTVLNIGGSYMMWYSGSDGATWRIGLATSSDGIQWTRHPGNPVLSPGSSGDWDESDVFAPAVIFDAGVYKMWYAGSDGNGVMRIGYATSPDGKNWTKVSILSGLYLEGWSSGGVSGPAVVKVGSLYHMWYTGDDGLTARIGHATGGDNYWEADAANPVLDLGAPNEWDWLNVYAPSVIQVGNEYQLWYSGETLPDTWQTGYSTSHDGVNWLRRGVMISQGGSGAFDAYSADYPSALVDGAGYRIWYSGFGNMYGIGHASASACGVQGAINAYLPMITRGPSLQSCVPYYTDDFANPASGWPVHDSGERTYAYVAGEYQIYVKNPFNGWFATSGVKAADFTVEVRARRTSGGVGAYGILFGADRDWSRFYEFLVEKTSYSLWRYRQGGYDALINWSPSGAILGGANWNHLKVIRMGTLISLYANGQHLATVDDGFITGVGRVALAANSADVPLDARFDDFALSPAVCETGIASSAVSQPGDAFEMGSPDWGSLPVPPGLDDNN